MSAREYQRALKATSNHTSPHSALLKAATDYLTLQGWAVFAIPASPYGRNGMPDKVAVRRGRHVWLECKTGRGELSEVQQQRKAELEAAGAEVVVFRCIEDLYVLGDEQLSMREG